MHVCVHMFYCKLSFIVVIVYLITFSITTTKITTKIKKLVRQLCELLIACARYRKGSKHDHTPSFLFSLLNGLSFRCWYESLQYLSTVFELLLSLLSHDSILYLAMQGLGKCMFV